MTDVWIDTDPSIGVPFHEADDGFALIQAFHSPELQIRGISTTYGNAGLATTTRIAREMAAQFGRVAGLTANDVFMGAASARDLGKPTPAADSLRAALVERPLTYLALAPLTNLATLLILHPEAARRIERVVFVGGRSPGVRFRAGRWNPYEFTDGNFHKDNAATATVLTVGPPLTLVPVECALQLLLTSEELAQIGREGGPSGRYLAAKARLWMNLWRLCFGTRGAAIFDCLAVLAVTHPHLFRRENRFAAIMPDPQARTAGNPRDVHLVASVNPGNHHAREVVFCRDPLPGARATLFERLVARAPDPLGLGKR
jgi:inosine-uridine nucleoside N-ribohydrolase